MSGHDACVIVGAGVFGLTAAVELAGAGRQVLLLDPGPVPRPLAASTDVAKAVRSAYGDDLVMTGLAERAIDGWLAWNRRWRTTLFHQDGILFLTREPMIRGGFEFESRELARARGRRVQTLSGEQIRERFAAWAPGVHAEGFLDPASGWVQSGAVIECLRDEALAQGVQMATGCALSALLVDEGASPRAVPVGETLPQAPVIGVRDDQGHELRAAIVIVAAGSWTPTLLPHLAHRLARSGHPLIHLAPADLSPWRPPRFCSWAADVTAYGWYGFAALPDGTLKLAHHGAGLPIDPEHPGEVPPAVVRQAREFLAEVLPPLANAPLARTRLCPYCDSLGERFLIDADPDRPGLVLATGGSGHAFKFAPLLGNLVARAVEGNPHPLFAWRPRDGRPGDAARGQT